MFKTIKCNLQLFADGGADGGGMSSGVAMGSDAGYADVGQVASDNGVNTTEDSNADAELEANYKAMVNGEYKKVHEKYFEKQMSRRLKGKDKQIAELMKGKEQADSVYDKLAIKYGVSDPTNVEAILQAMEQDNSYYEEYALRHGVDTETAKQLIKAERITAENERRLNEEQEMAQFRQQWDSWMQQAAEAQQYYPDFDFDYESNNLETGEQFARLINSGVPVKTAYEVVHHNELMGGAMQFAYNSARQEMADARTARTQRPRENGTSSQQASAVIDDMSKLSTAERRQIRAAVSRGEKVSPDNFRKYIRNN